MPAIARIHYRQYLICVSFQREQAFPGCNRPHLRGRIVRASEHALPITRKHCVLDQIRVPPAGRADIPQLSRTTPSRSYPRMQ